MASNITSGWSKDSVAVVTGANKGIGLEIVRLLAEEGLTVVLTARDQSRGEAALAGLKEKELTSIVFHQLDVNDVDSINSLASWLKSEFGGVDILVSEAKRKQNGAAGPNRVNNAALYLDSYDYNSAKSIVDSNYHGVKNVTKALLPLLRASANGARIVNVTSRAGLYNRLNSDTLKQKFKDEDKYSEQYADSLATELVKDVRAGGADKKWVTNAPGKSALYGESKMFLNVYSADLAKLLAQSQPKDHEIFLASACPGVTVTDMYHTSMAAGFQIPEGYPTKTAAEGADTMVWLALLPKNEWPQKIGRLFAERKEYPFGWENPPL